MRLLNTSSLLMEEFWDEDKTPLYAILSHTWEKEEVTFQHIQNLETASKLIGFSKIQACCRQAFADNFNWIWIDTCCIDKTSSAELSEAINSMFNWYQKSAACYAFLADVPSEDDSRSRECKFSKSRWFTRGWTLQELIAPPEVYFFSKDWIEIGCRTSLCLQIEEITGIDAEVLAGANDIKNKSVAQRMSWAAKRCTTRREDMAYCLMGLFDVNMPLLYGEGSKAFLRLQEEILKRSKDHSLFAWKATRPADLDAGEALMGGFLAKSPSDFEHSNHYVPCNEPYRYWLERPYSMTNMGLCIELPVFAMPGNDMLFIALLQCTSTNSLIEGNRIGFGLFLNNPLPFRWPNSLKIHRRAEALRPLSSLATRDIYEGPICVKVTDFSTFDGLEPLVTVELNSQQIKARVGSLCVFQGTPLLVV